MNIPKPQRYAFGLAGTIVGILAFSVAVLSPWIVDAIEPQPTVEDVAVEKAKSIWAKLKNEQIEEEKEKESTARVASILPPALTGAGLLSVILGIVSYLKREDRRFYRVAVGSGLATIIALFALAVAGALVLIILIAAIVGGGGT